LKFRADIGKLKSGLFSFPVMLWDDEFRKEGGGENPPPL
jgi:hypothetical protein